MKNTKGLKPKKYLILSLSAICVLSLAVGAALWVILGEKQTEIEKFTPIPIDLENSEFALTDDLAVSGAVYYGQDATLTGGTLTHNGMQIAGSWEINTRVSAKGTAQAFSVSEQIATFTPSGEHAKIYSGTLNKAVTLQMNAVALYAGEYYSTLDGALTAANTANSGTVYSLALGKTVDEGIAKEAKTLVGSSGKLNVNSGVTLRLPYSNDALDTDKNIRVASGTNNPPASTNNYSFSMFDYNSATYKTNQIYVGEGVTVTNNGTVIIAGEVSGGAGHSVVNSMTAGYHGQINLNSGAKITNNKTLTCYGYINGDATTEVVSAAGTLQVIITIVEHRGGAGYFGMINPNDDEIRQEIIDKALEGSDLTIAGGKGESDYSPTSLKTSPFNRFYVENITSNLTIKPASAVNAYANLYADNVSNETTIKLVGASGSGAFVELQNSDAELCGKYDISTKTHDFDFYGDVKINPFSLKIAVAKSISKGITVNVKMNVYLDTANVFFPVSSHLNLSFNKSKTSGTATVDLSSGQSKFKLLPGSVVSIGKGVTVNAGAIAVYQDNSLLPSATQFTYQSTTPAQLNIAGTLNVGQLGGVATATQTGAQLNVTTASALSLEMSSVASGNSTVSLPLSEASSGLISLVGGIADISFSLPYKEVTYFSDAECTFAATGDTFNASGAEQVNATLEARTYYGAQISGSNYAWQKLPFTVTVNGVYEGNGVKPSATKVIERTTAGGYSLTRLADDYYYQFSHFCTNEGCANGSDCANRISGQIFVDTTVYEIWILKEYTVVYKNDDGTTLTDAALGENLLTLSAESSHRNQAIPIPTKEGSSFMGWETENGTAVSTYNNTLFAQAVNMQITLVANWTTAVQYKLAIDYGDYADKASENDWDSEALAVVGGKLPTIVTTGIDSDPTIAHYFGGWLDKDGTPITTLTDSMVDSITDPATQTVTIKANWLEKYVLTFSVEYPSDVVGEVATISNIPNSLYLKGDEPYNLSQYDHLLTGNDEVRSVSVYYNGWVVTSGTASISDGLLTFQSDTTVSVNWASKYKLSFETGYPEGTLGGVTPISIASVYLTPTQSYDLSQHDQSLAVEDDNKAVDRYFANWLAIGNATISGSVITLTGDATAKVNWETKCKVTFDTTKYGDNAINTSTITLESVFIKPNGSYDLTDEALVSKLTIYDLEHTVNKYFGGWSNNGTPVSGSVTITQDTTLTVVWETKATINLTIKYSKDGEGLYETSAKYEIQIDAGSGPITVGSDTITKKTQISPFYVKQGHKLIVKTTEANGTLTERYNAEVVGDVNKEFTAYYRSCIVEGTLVTLADGTKKAVEDLQNAEEVLVFNHETGKLEKSYIAIRAHLEVERAWYNVINLEFSDGSVLRIVWNHGLYNLTLNKYVFINEGNYGEYVGDSFYSAVYENGAFIGKSVTLVRAYITYEFVKIYSPTTVSHINFFASNMLNVTAIPVGALDCGHVNIFDYDSDMKYDEAKKQADIEKYGLYTYEDFKDYVSYEVYQYLDPAFKYLKVAVEKGKMTWEEVLALLRYITDNDLIDEETPME